MEQIRLINCWGRCLFAEQRLWHNVTLLLLDFVGRADAGPYLIDLFEK